MYSRIRQADASNGQAGVSVGDLTAWLDQELARNDDKSRSLAPEVWRVASSGLLPEGFAFDPGWPWLRLIGFGEDVTKESEEHRQREVLAREMGFADNASLERAKRFAALPESLIGRLKDFFAFQGA